MTAAQLVPIEIATNANDGEFVAWQIAAVFLGNALEGQCLVKLTQHESPEEALAAPATLVGLSLLSILETGQEFPEIESALANCCAKVTPDRVTFVSTILRHFPDSPPAGMTRLRRLNLLATQLSQRFGVFVIDIDRALAHRGALALETDARLTGTRGQEAAARVIAHAMLAYGLSGVVNDETLDLAINKYEATMDSEIDQLLLPLHMVSRQVTRIGGRSQVYLAIGPNFDERSFKGLLRDMRHGRLSAAVTTIRIGRKVGSRILAMSRSRFRRV